ncbi:MAG: NTP transferase domain-containing protein [bacterium]
MDNLKTVILAAGKGTRMRTEGSDLPKVMREALGRPLLQYVLDAVPGEPILVVGYQREKVLAAFPQYPHAVQEPQHGTGHAVQCAAPLLEGFAGDVLICYGDTPLITRETLTGLVALHRAAGNDCTVLAGSSAEPMPGLGRVVCTEEGGFVKIVEERDCTPEERDIRVYNSGMYVFSCPKLLTALAALRPENAQHEYYLTDCPAIMLARGDKVGVCVRDMGAELLGVNTPEQLSEVERYLESRN